MTQTLDQLRAGELVGIQRLALKCGLTEFPHEIYSLADTLEILDLSGNQLSSLPDDLHRLHRLRVIFCSDNAFTELPTALGQCPALTMVGFKANRIHTVPAASLPSGLQWLILTNNCIAELPESLGQCTQLQKLALAGNQLTTLPATLAQCKKLELLRISANQLHELPDWLLTLPQLTWLAFAGNPFCQPFESTDLHNAQAPTVDWQDLQIQHILGEGASGVIHQAILTRADAEPHTVAVKVFKGEMTSDGLPSCEMAACLHAGAHAHLITAQARVVNHPQQLQALMMPCIDASFVTLAAPPSLETCTRDVYLPGAFLSSRAALRIAVGITAAALHLHQLGLMHGDLYAHNILYVPSGQALLGDFGAASFYDPTNVHMADALQGIEVRALGCLLEELMLHTRWGRGDDASRQLMQTLLDLCMRPQPTNRPKLIEVMQHLMHAQVKLQAN